MTQTTKITAYIKQRLLGLEPLQAARLAGYSEGPGLSVTTSRNEAREDVRAALRKAKREGVVLGRVVTKQKASGRGNRRAMEEGEVGGDTLNNPEAWALKDRYDEPLDLLMDVMNNKKAPQGLRIQCAKDAMPYRHARKEGTKGDEKAKNAKEAGNGFQPQARPSHLRRAA